MGNDLAKFVQTIQESIARRAYELFDARGGEAGQDLLDWFHAEAEMMHPLNEEITESRDKVTVRAVVSGFSADDLKIGVAPRRVTISGKREESSKDTRGASHEASIRMLSMIDLPVGVDPEKSTASLQGKELTIALPKTSSQ
ncbi:MAG: Hsp20 family protein [Terriglobia bacterium]